MSRLLVFLAALAIAVSGCSTPAHTAAAEQAVLKFHELFDAGQFAEIYESSSSELKDESSQQDFVAFLEGLHKKLGNSQSSEKQGFRVSYNTAGTFVSLTYKTLFTAGEATEQFVFRLQGDTASLVGYHINHSIKDI